MNHYYGKSPNSSYLKQTYIACKLKNHMTGTKIYYLHGSWFIISNKDDELKKLSFGQDSKDTMDSIFEHDCRPDLILEDRSLLKKALIENKSTYHNFCFEQLSNIKGDLLIFGCSFEHDGHILDKISENINLNLLITFIEDNEINTIREKCQKIQKRCRFIKVDKHVIWENGNDLVGKYKF